MYKLLFVLLLVSQAATAEVYYVTFVKGNVKVAGQAKNLVTGNKINDNDQLVFADKSAKLSCISPTKGRFDISSDKAAKNSRNEWVAILKDALVPAYTSKHLSTRSLGDGETDPAMLFKTNITGGKVLLIEDQWITVSNSYHLNATNFFFLQYEVDGKTIVKKVPASANKIAFNASLFTNANGAIVSQESVADLALCFQETVNGTARSKVVVKFMPVMISASEFNTQASLIKKNLEPMHLKKELVNKELYNHFYSNYGYIHPAFFTALMESF